jgi:MFS family permease
MSIPYIISAVLSPFLGAFVDKFGMRAIVATIAPATLIIVHAVLGYSVVDPIGPLVGQGLAYSAFAAVLWPSVPLVCEQKFIGLGYGIVTSVQNIGLAVFPVIIG